MTKHRFLINHNITEAHGIVMAVKPQRNLTHTREGEG